MSNVRASDAFREIFADRVKSAMDASGLGVRDWATVFDLPYGTVSKVRNGHVMPGLERAAQIASCLDVSLDWLCGETDEGGPDASPES